MIHQSDREIWLEARRGYITSSDVARLLCEGWAKSDKERFEQRGQLIMEKAGLADSWEGNEHTSLAGDLELPLIQIAAKRWDIDLRPCGFLMTDPECPGHAGTPDAFWHHGDLRMPVNIKWTTTQPQEDCKPKKDGAPSEAAYANGLPLYHQIQSQSEQAISGAHHGAMLVMHHGRSLTMRMYVTSRHDALIARIRKEIETAWGEIIALREGKIAV